MLTLTSLSHPTIEAKIYASLHRAVRLSKRTQYKSDGIVYINNAKGMPFLRVRYNKNQGFDFYRGNKNMTEKVLTAIKSHTIVDIQPKQQKVLAA